MPTQVEKSSTPRPALRPRPLPSLRPLLGAAPRASSLLDLQRAVGNQAVQRLLHTNDRAPAPPAVQRLIKIEPLHFARGLGLKDAESLSDAQLKDYLNIAVLDDVLLVGNVARSRGDADAYEGFRKAMDQIRKATTAAQRLPLVTALIPQVNAYLSTYAPQLTNRDTRYQSSVNLDKESGYKHTPLATGAATWGSDQKMWEEFGSAFIPKVEAKAYTTTAARGEGPALTQLPWEDAKIMFPRPLVNLIFDVRYQLETSGNVVIDERTAEQQQRRDKSPNEPGTLRSWHTDTAGMLPGKKLQGSSKKAEPLVVPEGAQALHKHYGEKSQSGAGSSQKNTKGGGPVGYAEYTGTGSNSEHNTKIVLDYLTKRVYLTLTHYGYWAILKRADGTPEFWPSGSQGFPQAQGNLSNMLSKNAEQYAKGMQPVWMSPWLEVVMPKGTDAPRAKAKAPSATGAKEAVPTGSPSTEPSQPPTTEARVEDEDVEGEAAEAIRLTSPEQLLALLSEPVKRKLQSVSDSTRSFLLAQPFAVQRALWRLDETAQLDVLDVIEALNTPGSLARPGQASGPLGTASMSRVAEHGGLVLDLVRFLANILGTAFPSQPPASTEPSSNGQTGGSPSASKAPKAPEPILVERDEGLSFRVTEALIDAYRTDLIHERPYLSEAEGHELAKYWQVEAEVFKPTGPGSSQVQRHAFFNQGGGSKGKGILLHRGENHYVVLVETSESGPRYADVGGSRSFNVLYETISNGDCLIDALHRLHTPTTVSDETALDARAWLFHKLSDTKVQLVLTPLLDDLLRGIEPSGIGEATQELLESDPIWGVYERAYAERLERQRLEAAKARSAEEANKQKETTAEAEPKPPLETEPTNVASETSQETASETPGRHTKPSAKRPPSVRQPLNADQIEALRRLREANETPGVTELEEQIGAARRKLETGGSSTGYPHVFNKLFVPLEAGLADVLERAGLYGQKLDKATAFAEQAKGLSVEFEKQHRHALIAMMPPTKGPDENSLAFGSNGSALRTAIGWVFQATVDYLGEEDRSAREEKAALLKQRSKLVQAQFVRLHDAAFDKEAADWLRTSNAKTGTSTTDAKANATRIREGQAYLQQRTAEVTGQLLPGFFEAIANALTPAFRDTSPKKPDEPSPTPEATAPTEAPKADADYGRKLAAQASTSLETFRAQIGKHLETLEGLSKEVAAAQKTKVRDPFERPMEYLKAIAARHTTDTWGWALKEMANAATRKAAQQAARPMSDALDTDKGTVARIMAHATQGWKAHVLPKEASPSSIEKDPKTGVSTATFPVIGDPRLVSYGSTNARNVTYASKDAAYQATRQMLGLADDAKPHAKYVLTPDKTRPPAADADDDSIWIKAAPSPDQSKGSPDEGWVEEYATPQGPMLLVYHANDCTQRLRLLSGDAKKQRPEDRHPVPHFHVATLPPNDIPLDYWETADPAARTPALGIDVRGTPGMRTASGAKTYRQHETEHHLYHL